MKPAPVSYFRPESLSEVLSLLSRYGDHSRILAGGQTLVPLLSQRLLDCSVLIDTNRVSALTGITASNAHLRIGAMTRQSALEKDPLIAEHFPEMAKLLPYLGFPAIRNRGTIGGSLAWADPSAELPALALALDGYLELHSAHRGIRRIFIDDFLESPFKTNAQSDELLVALELPLRSPLPAHYAREVALRAIGRASAGIIATAGPSTLPHATVFGWSDRPRRFPFPAPPSGQNASPQEWIDAIEIHLPETVWQTDAHGTADYRRFLVGSLLGEAATCLGISA